MTAHCGTKTQLSGLLAHSEKTTDAVKSLLEKVIQKLGLLSHEMCSKESLAVLLEDKRLRSYVDDHIKLINDCAQFKAATNPKTVLGYLIAQRSSFSFGIGPNWVKRRIEELQKPVAQAKPESHGRVWGSFPWSDQARTVPSERTESGLEMPFLPEPGPTQ